MTKGKQQIEWIEPKALRPFPANPSNRTDPKSLADLVESMSEVGYIEDNPVIVGSDGYIGDGHRRTKSAIICKIDSIPVVHSKRTSQEIMRGNFTQRAFRTRDFDHLSVNKEFSYDNLPKRFKKKYDEASRVIGLEGMQYAHKHDRSWSQHFASAKRLANYVRVALSSGEYDDFVKKAYYWIIKHNKASFVRELKRWAPSENLIKESVMKNKNLKPKPIEWE